MGYYRNITGNLTFESKEDEKNFLEFVSKVNDANFKKENCSSIEKFLEEELYLFCNKEDSEEYSLNADGNYREEDEILAQLLKESGVNVSLFMEYSGEDSDWRTEYSIEKGIQSENMVYLSDVSVKDILKTLSEEKKRELLTELRLPYIMEDLRSVNGSLSDKEAEILAGRYLNGRYDCNLSYWENLQSLIEEGV